MPTPEAAININVDSARFARESILNWFRITGRDFPWRHFRTPYHVLIAELMLRRTQARQVVTTYERFISIYPDIWAVDRASESDVTDILHPLGLSWRAKNFKTLAHKLVDQYAGIIPNDRKALLELPGVGPYVADAIRCFAFGHSATLADTNTVRVAARYFGFSYTPESRRQPAVISAISHLVDANQPDQSNYALLDFAALVCKSQSPQHNICPLSARCSYYINRVQTET